MWKLGNFSATKILHEINFCRCGVSIFAILRVSAALKFGFVNFCILTKLKCPKNQDSEPLKLSKFQFLRHYNLVNLISHKMCGSKKSEISTLCCMTNRIQCCQKIMNNLLAKSIRTFFKIIDKIVHLMATYVIIQGKYFFAKKHFVNDFCFNSMATTLKIEPKLPWHILYTCHFFCRRQNLSKKMFRFPIVLILTI